MNTVPRSLRRWFVLHFLLDMLFGIPLLLFPAFVLNIFGLPVGSLLMARLVGAALVGIGGVSLVENKNGLEGYNTLLTLKIIWACSALIALLLALMNGADNLVWAVFCLFAAFLALWIYYKIKLRE